MNKAWRAAVAAGLTLAFGAPAWSADVTAAPLPPSAPPAAPAPVKTVVLTRLVVKMPPGTQWAVMQKGMFCAPATALTYTGGESALNLGAFIDTFRTVFSAAGLHPEPEPSLFDPTAVSPSEFALAGVVTDLRVHTCANDASPTGSNKVKGEVSFTIDWQLYSRLEKQVVATVHTSGGFSTEDPVNNGVVGMENRAFAENVKLLAADAKVRKILSGAGLADDELVKPPAQPSLVVPGALAVRPSAIDKAAEGVVVIYSGNALGSGFLISPDGYILTDAHVVGDARAVRLRWFDGKEGSAIVERVSKGRDVALIKADPAGRRALPLRQDTPEIGATVYAIGAPDGDKFEGTVTRGVISATRVFQGFAYIQSDVTTGHGGSGGPLLDEDGRVIGLTEGVRNAQTSSGLNFFNPIKDAIAFLALDLR